ncbi:UDP-glucose 4-epimerase [Marchantia polymorpha subsp. ruderalis]
MPGSPFYRRRNPPARGARSWSFAGLDYGMSRPRSQLVVKVVVAATLTALCMFILRQSSSSASENVFSRPQEGVQHVLVTGGAGFIGSHAAMLLLEKENYRVTIVDNLSRGNLGAIHVLQRLFPEPGRLQYIFADLGDAKAVDEIFAKNAFDAVMHFAAIAYVGESMAEPLRYYHNITTNTLLLLEAMAKHEVSKFIYSSTCATYGEPKKMPITEDTEQVPINPYGKAKKMAEEIIKDYARTKRMAVMILRYFNVIGSDPKLRLGEAPRPELRVHGRISGACFDAARGFRSGLEIRGDDYNTKDGTCIRDYIHVTDLVEAHIKALDRAETGKVGIYNVGTGKGLSVKEFVEACKAATKVNITVTILDRRPGDYAEVYSQPKKINDELGWKAKHVNLTETLEVAWKWQLKYPNGYNNEIMSAV